MIYDTQGAQRMPGRGDQRRSGVEPHMRRAGVQRVVVKALVETSVFDH